MMGILVRRDLDLLGYKIELKEIKSRRLIVTYAYADLIVDNQTIPCIATFFRFRKGVRVDLILDKDKSDQILKDYIQFMSQSPSLLIELLVRFIVSSLATVCFLIAFVYLGYLFITYFAGMPLDNLSLMYDLDICIVLSLIVRFLLDTI